MQKEQNKTNFWAYTLVFLAFAGFADAVYLAALHYAERVPVCSLLEGCDLVTGSEYAVVAGIPIALIGSVYYAVLVFLAALYATDKKISRIKYALGLSGAGVLAYLYLVYIQAFVLEAYCVYCLLSAAATLLCFLTAAAILAGERRKESSRP